MPGESTLVKILSGLRERFTGEKKSVTPRPLPLKLVFFIVDWPKANVISGVFAERNILFHFISKGRGTASSEILHLLGLGPSDKAVITCLEQTAMVPALIIEVWRKLGFNTPGAGVAFSIPLSAINDPLLLVFRQGIRKKGGGFMASDLSGDTISGSAAGDSGGKTSHDLIIAVVNHGYCDEFMNTARAAGATGGTVITARGQAHAGAVQFLGISVQDEKEMIIILTNRENKVGIMRAVCEAHGLNTKAQGIVFSLPVDSVMGLNFE